MKAFLRRLGATIGDAWRWWLAELAASVPAPVRQWFGGMRGRQLLVADAAGGMLFYEAAGRREALGRLATIAAAGRALRHPRTVIEIPGERGLRTTLTLPLAAAANLAQVIGFEIERQTPFRRADVFFAHRIVARDTKARSLVAELTVVPRAPVEAALRLAQSHRLAIVGVELAAHGAAIAPSPNLLPQSQRPAGGRPRRLALIALAATTLALAIAALAIPLLQAEAAAADLARRVADAKRAADASLELRKEIEGAAEDARFLVDRKRQTPAVSELLDRLTRLLPDDTWLVALQMNSSEVQLSGYGATATALLGLLDESADFTDAAFRSPVTRDSKLERERFEIAAKLKRKAAK